jgi:hypothetical protein
MVTIIVIFPPPPYGGPIPDKATAFTLILVMGYRPLEGSPAGRQRGGKYIWSSPPEQTDYGVTAGMGTVIVQHLIKLYIPVILQFVLYN